LRFDKIFHFQGFWVSLLQLFSGPAEVPSIRWATVVDAEVKLRSGLPLLLIRPVAVEMASYHRQRWHNTAL